MHTKLWLGSLMMKPPSKQKQQMDYLWDIVKTWIELGFCDKQSETNK